MKRVYSLDVLRIVATIFIVFHHYQQFTGTFFEGKINFCGGQFYFGLLVEFFFVLSGFLAYKYVEREQVSFKDYYLPKVKRLLPLVLITGVAYEGFLVIYNHVCQRSWLLGNGGTIWGLIITALGIQSGWVFQNLMVNDVAWYVSVLLLCYIVFYLLMYISKKKNIRTTYLFIAMLFVGAGIISYGINLPFLNPNSARGFYTFFFGLLLAEVLKNREIGVKEGVVSLVFIVAMTFGLVNYDGYFSDGISYILTFLYYPAWMILFLSKPVRKIFNHKIFGVLGAFTYSVYLWHIPMILLMYVVLEWLPVTIDIHTVGAMVLFTVGMFVVGALSHYLLERPINKLLEKK